jgi:hypothetical protein
LYRSIALSAASSGGVAALWRFGGHLVREVPHTIDSLHGLSSIVRGTVPFQFFGPAGYGAMLGRLSAPGLAIRDAAPLAFAVMMERAGLSVSAAGLVALSGVAALALLRLARAATAGG